MKFWPLFIGIFVTGYYATWLSHWYIPLEAAILVMLLLWGTSFGVVGIIVGAILTLILSPMLYVIAELLYIRLH